MATQSRHQQSIRLLLAVVLVQLVYWLLVHPMLFARAKAPPRIAMGAASAAHIAQPDWESVQKAEFVSVKLPYHDCCHAPGYRAVRVQFDLPELPKRALGMVANTWADNFTIHLNGHLLSERGRMQLPDITYNGLDRQIFFVSPGLLQRGSNEVTLVMVRDTIGDFAVAPPLLADFATLSQHLAKRDYILNDYLIVSYTIGIVLGLLALVLLLRSSDRRLPCWALLLLSAWVLRLLFLESTDPPVSGPLRLWLGYTLMGLLAVSWLNFVDSWTGKPIPWLASGSLIAWAVHGGVCAWILNADVSTAADRLDASISLFGGTSVVLVILRLLWHTFRQPEPRHWEAAIFLLCITLMALDLAELVSGTSRFFNGVNTSLPILMLGLAVSFFARNLHLFRSMNEFNQLLATRLRKSEAQMQQVWQERQALVRQSVLAAERQRIMRDMHDGLGGRLVSLAAQLAGPNPEHRGLDRSDVSRELLAALTDMRLIVDSLDTAGDDLGMAIGAFRSRMEPSLHAAGLQTQWQIDNEAAGLELPAAAVLDIYRILQEAFSNVLRHAKARQITLRVYRHATEGTSIEVCDDGVGLDEADGSGRGRDNMRTRAVRLGAQLHWHDAHPGTCVCLHLPASLRRNAEPADPNSSAEPIMV